MGKISKKNNGGVENEEAREHVKKQTGLTKSSTSDEAKTVSSKHFERNENVNNKPQHSLSKKKDFVNIIKNEYQFISGLFEILDLSKLNHGRKNESDEEENSDSLQLADIPEQKVFKKQTQKKGSQASTKTKSFPSTVEGLEKELAELKGTPMTYHTKLRKKGLQTRLLKKKRKEQIKLRKATLKSAKKRNPTINGLSKSKMILNSDGSVVSNKFDFAETDIKKENKNKTGAVFEANKSQSRTIANGNINMKVNGGENFSNVAKSDSNNINNLIKNETKHSEDLKTELNLDVKPTNRPVFNKDNKMVFSKIYLPENNKKAKNEFKNKNPKKILEKLKEEKKKISDLEREDKGKADYIKEKTKWATALKRAGGEKVKDDPELLRKSIAREKNQKVRSQKKWKARIDHIEKEKQEKQKKRKDNIQARKTEKKKKKMKKAVKKGSYVPL